MDTLLAFFNQPIVLTVISLAVGGYLFSRLSDRRARRDKTREKAIEFIEEVGNDLNSVISLLYGHIRSGNLQVPKDSLLNQRAGGLFLKRFSVRVRSKAYLKSEDFWRKYDYLVWEFNRIVRFVATCSNDYELEQVVAEIQAHKKRFAEAWPLEDEALVAELDLPFSELSSWTGMIWNRAVWLLSSNLETILK